MADNRYDDAAARALIAEGAVNGMMRWCEAVLGESVAEAPHGMASAQDGPAQGTLAGSATIMEADAELLERAARGADVRVEALLAYPLIYAAYQHRGMRYDGTYIIRNRPAGGKSNFLSDPVKNRAPDLQRALAAGVRERLGT